jgi:hypothetical protein
VVPVAGDQSADHQAERLVGQGHGRGRQGLGRAGHEQVPVRRDLQGASGRVGGTGCRVVLRRRVGAHDDDAVQVVAHRRLVGHHQSHGGRWPVAIDQGCHGIQGGLLLGQGGARTHVHGQVLDSVAQEAPDGARRLDLMGVADGGIRQGRHRRGVDEAVHLRLEVRVHRHHDDAVLDVRCAHGHADRTPGAGRHLCDASSVESDDDRPVIDEAAAHLADEPDRARARRKGERDRSRP